MEETRKTVRKRRAAAAPKPAAPGRARSPVEREEMVRTAAYFRAERRGFEPGYEWEDWLAAEAEVKARAGAPRASQGRKAPARKRKAGPTGRVDKPPGRA
jgi:hypothetical protein